jgi:hypothetical protein
MTHISGAATILLLGPALEGSLDGPAVVWGSLAGLSGAFAVVALYTGFTRSSLAVVSPIAAVGGGVWPVLWDTVTGTPPSAVVAAGIVLGLIAIWTISGGGEIDPSDDVRAGVLFGSLAGLGFGGLLIFLSLTPETSGTWTLLPARVVGGLAIVVLALALHRPLAPNRPSIAPAAASGVLTVFGNGSFILATTFGSLAVVSVLAAMFPAATVVLARIFLHERLTPRRRGGLVLALIAVGLVAAG